MTWHRRFPAGEAIFQDSGRIAHDIPSVIRILGLAGRPKLCVPLLPAIFTHRIAAHLDAMGIVNQPVEDGIGHERIAGNCDVRITQKSRRSRSDSGAPWPNRRSPSTSLPAGTGVE
jgi:hypothetical protein